MATIAVVGVGAVGGAVVAHLHSGARHRIVACVRAPLPELRVETPEGLLRARPLVVREIRDLPEHDWMLLATKAHQTAGAASWLAAARKLVAVLQNGVEHVARVSPLAPGAEILPVVVECPATVVEPGRVLQRAPACLRVPATGLGARFRELFDGTRITVELCEDFVTTQWFKLCENAAGGALTALFDREIGIVRRPAVERLARALLAEAVAVARAEGAALGDGHVEELLRRLREAPPDAGTSMLADRRRGRPLEYDARNGAVVRSGRRHGIPTPMNARVAACLAELSARGRARRG